MCKRSAAFVKLPQEHSVRNVSCLKSSIFPPIIIIANVIIRKYNFILSYKCVKINAG